MRPVEPHFLLTLLESSFADCPQVSLHGLLATRQILLCIESCFVGSNVLQRFGAGCYSGSYGCEGCTCSSLLLRQLATGLVIHVRLADVDASAVRVSGWRGTVSTNQIVTMTVTIHFLRFCQASLYILDT